MCHIWGDTGLTTIASSPREVLAAGKDSEGCSWSAFRSSLLPSGRCRLTPGFCQHWNTVLGRSLAPRGFFIHRKEVTTATWMWLEGHVDRQPRPPFNRHSINLSFLSSLFSDPLITSKIIKLIDVSLPFSFCFSLFFK